MTDASGSQPSAIEVEWQFDADDLGAVERWLRAQPSHAALRFVPGNERVQRDEYLDSADWRIHRAGYTLRVRRFDDHAEATMKAAATSDEGPRRRLELNQDLPGDATDPSAAPGPVTDRLALLLGAQPLRPLFTIETRRLPFAIEQDGRKLAVLTLDEAVVHGAADSEPIRRVEVEESYPGALSRISQFIDALRTTNGLQLSTHSKFQAGLMAAGLEPSHAADLGPLALDPAGNAGDFGYATLRRYYADMLGHEPGTRLGEDPEELHQMRVATRRLRAAMSTFMPVLPADLYAQREELRWLAAVLGAVRDLDVQIESLETIQSEAAWDEGTAIGPLIETVREQHLGARNILVAALDSERYNALTEAMTASLRAGAPDGLEAANEAVRTFAVPVLRKRYKQLRRDASALSPEAEAPAYHQVRIRSKRLRYSVEFFEPLFGRPASQFISAIKGAQDLLGDHQDSDVAMAWLRGLVLERGSTFPPDTLFVMGELVERHRSRMASLRRGWPEVDERLRARWKPLRRALDHTEGRQRERSDARAEREVTPTSSIGILEPPPAQYRFLRLPGFTRRTVHTNVQPDGHDVP